MVTDTPSPSKDRFQKAVAVQTSDEAALPRITASGRGKIAEKILELAFENQVKVRQDSDLTDILEQLEVESPIPLEALSAVTEILRYVYQLNGNMAQAEREDGEY